MSVEWTFWSQIFRLAKTFLKALLHRGQSKRPIVSSVLVPFLSGRPAIFHVFLGVETSIPQPGHFAIYFSSIMTVHHCLILNISLTM